MARDGSVRFRYDADISEVRAANREASREMEKLAQTSQRTSQGVAKEASNAASNVQVIGAKAQTTAKHVEKIGSSANTALSYMSPIATALGLAAAGSLGEIAAAAIGHIAKNAKSSKSQLREAAAAMRDYNLANLAAAGSVDGVTEADERVIDATKKLDDARRSGKSSAREIAGLERDVRSAMSDQYVAHTNLAKNREEARKATRKYADELGDVIGKSNQFTEVGARSNARLQTQADRVRDAAANLRDYAGTTANLTDEERAAYDALADLIEKTGEVPEDIETVIKQPGMNPALDRMSALNAQYDRADGRTVTTRVDTVIETNRLDNAAGAFFGGTPNTKDDIPVNVSQGEAILNPRQINMLGRDRVMGVLAATGANMIGPGGGYARGGKPKKIPASERLQKVLDRAKDRFGALMSRDDLALAKAEQTTGFADDAAVLSREQRHIRSRISEIRHARRAHKHLTRDQRQDLNDEEASLIRQLADLGEQIRDGSAPGGGDGGLSQDDPFALDRARAAGVAEGLGRLESMIFGSPGDIGTAGGGTAVASLQVGSIVIAPSPRNYATLANGSNRGNATANRTRSYSSRQGVMF